MAKVKTLPLRDKQVLERYLYKKAYSGITSHIGKCGKRCFKKADAEFILARLQRKLKKGTASVFRQETRVYYCSICDSYHLTKQAKTKPINKKERRGNG